MNENGEGTQNYRLDRIENVLEKILEKFEDMPVRCETYRGNIHERINKLYFWMLGAAGSLMVGMIILIMRGI
ncbi:MAG: hypothetical protein DRJ03_02765 [Chloroflexi bacterium]|nr:MAG: hypothetical protein DRJ03_02765 [Chloroflexota bacterium]